MLRNNSITGTLALADLPRLQTLDATFNALSVLSDFCAAAPALSDVRVYGNRIFGPLPNLSKCFALTWFLAQDNLFTGGLSTLRLPPSLKYINISSNLLDGDVGGSWALAAPSLLTLDASANRLRGLLPSVPPALLYLRLQHNRISGPINAEYASASSRLIHVDLSFNNISSVPRVFAAPNLLLLMLQNNSIGGLLPSFDDCYSLYSLSLANNRCGIRLLPHCQARSRLECAHACVCLCVCIYVYECL
jgi:Leucine-rich repeat (LRR) protein